MAERSALVLTHSRQEWAHSWTGAFAEGLRRRGWQVHLSYEFRRCDLLVSWGLRHKEQISRQHEAGGDICILERGYLLDRLNDWASVSFGGRLNNRAEFRGPLTDPSRWEKHFAHAMRPWNARKDGCVLILGQVPGDRSVTGVNLDNFYLKARQAFSELGYPVKFRPHPVVQERARRDAGCLATDLKSAALAVTWNSNSGVDAVLAGVPTVAMDEGSMAWDVSGHELRPPPMPDRTAWAHAMAWKQWNRDEMASGECWAHIGI